MGTFFAFLIFVFLGSAQTAYSEPGTLVAQPAAQTNEKAVADQLFQKIVDQGFVVTLGPLKDMKAHAELLESGQYVLTINVALKASPAGREALETTARQLGGLSMDATLEVDVGMAKLPARAVRISADPKTLEYFQRRVGSLVFIVELGLDNGEAYTCATGDHWRFPITPVGQVFVFAGRASISFLGLSPAFDTNDYGFVAIRNGPISFKYRPALPEADFKRLTRVEGKVMHRKGNEREGECVKIEKTTAQTPQ